MGTISIMAVVQNELHSPKSQTNAFGKYNYRSCEDIVEAVKPLLAKHDCHLNITDEIVMLGDRFYVRATASVMSGTEAIATSSAYAREAFSQKGMQESQLTGATSSYARKYALNGLFAIDDTKDADSADNRNYEQVNPTPIRQQYVDRAYDVYKECVDADTEEVDFKKMQEVDSLLSNDERIAVINKFGKEKPEGATKMYVSIINECLKTKAGE